MNRSVDRGSALTLAALVGAAVALFPMSWYDIVPRCAAQGTGCRDGQISVGGVADTQGRFFALAALVVAVATIIRACGPRGVIKDEVPDGISIVFGAVMLASVAHYWLTSDSANSAWFELGYDTHFGLGWYVAGFVASAILCIGIAGTVRRRSYEHYLGQNR